jgi:hypothetical protein
MMMMPPPYGDPQQMGTERRPKRRRLVDEVPGPVQPSDTEPAQGGWSHGWGMGQQPGAQQKPGGPQMPPMMYGMSPPPGPARPTTGPGMLPGMPTMPTAPTGLHGEMEDFARGGLRTPGRWDSELMKQGGEVIQNQIRQMRGEGNRSLDETFAARGLLGSNVETEGKRTFETDLQNMGSERLFNLQREAANANAADRQAAAGTALGTLGYGADERWRAIMKDLDLMRMLGLG